MPKYLITRRRASWIEEKFHVEADSPEAALEVVEWGGADPIHTEDTGDMAGTLEDVSDPPTIEEIP